METKRVMNPFMRYVGLVLTLVACQSKQVIPAQGLYQTWEQQLSPISSVGPLVLTFRQDGQVLYGASPQEARCCQPTRFSQAGKQLTFWGTSQRPDCALVYCGQSPLVTSSPWTMTSLTDVDLVLSANGQQLTFKRR